LISPPASERAHVPANLTLAITNGCNLHCSHCWPDSTAQQLHSSTPLRILERIVAEFVGLGVEHVCLTGGEPLTHPAWFDLLAFTCGLPGVREVCLQTNGTLLREDQVRALAMLGGEGLVVQVSLDGATAETHDRLRGAGSFAQALRALRLLAEYGLGNRTRVAFTEMRHNFSELPGLLELLEGMGIGRLVSGTLVRHGRAGRNELPLPPTPEQYRDLLGLFYTHAQFRNRYTGLGNIAALEWHIGQTNCAANGCACLDHPYVTADGRIYPCAMLQAGRYAVTGVHERPVAELLAEALPLWAEIPSIRRRRALELEACAGCSGRRHCSGGCLGRAYAAHGQVMAVEDRCSLRKAVYTWNRADSLPFGNDGGPPTDSRGEKPDRSEQLAASRSRFS
jgi:radical SAM protein with 4Fe4S-binding SPASM domain